jgi:hypothetical protein
MPAFKQVVYISQATGTFAESELNQLAEVSRRNNKEHGITGAM